MLSKGFNNTQIIIRHQTLIKTNNFIYIVIVENLTNHNKNGFEKLFSINKGNNKITELRTILQRESQNS
jgi:hypothetical protein